MNQELTQKYRGVICQCCHQPIPLPSIVQRLEDSYAHEAAEISFARGARVFALRCRSCEREMPYQTGEIVEINGAPKPRLSRSKGRAVAQSPGLSRAANA